jgi:hypothetical protein
MATLTYNNVQLEIGKTNNCSHRAIYTPDGSNTYLWTEVELDIDAVLNPAATAYVAGDPPVATPGTLPPVTIAAIRHALLQPRGYLLYTSPNPGDVDNPFVIVEAPQQQGAVDLNNGPMPLSCTVKEVAGSKYFLINYRIKCWIHECPNGEDVTDINNVLLANRYSQRSDINFQHLSTKITEGEAVFRIDVLENAAFVADHFRSLLARTVSPGFKRTRISVWPLRNGNVIRYSYVDEEQMTDLGDTDARNDDGPDGGTVGSGIVKLEGYYGLASTNTSEGIPGGTTQAQCDIRAWGNKYSSNWRMIQRCLEIVLAKITLGAGGIGFIRNAAIRESLVDRFVEVNIGFVQLPPANVQIGALNTNGLQKDDIFEDQDGVNPPVPNSSGTRGTAIEDLLVAELTSACQAIIDYSENPESDGEGDSSEYAGPPTAIQVTPVDELPEQPSPYSESTQQYPYTIGKLDIKYSRDEGVLVAPVASGPGAGGNPVALFRLYPKIGYKVVDFTMERLGACPSIPSPQVSDPNLTLLDSDITLACPEPTNDGATKVWRVSGWYKYVFSQKTIGPGDTLDAGALPWTTDVVGSNQIISSQDYSPGIIDGGQESSSDSGPDDGSTL